MVRHKTRTYPGQHPAIIRRDLWDRVQARLLASRARPRVKAGGGADGLPEIAPVDDGSESSSVTGPTDTGSPPSKRQVARCGTASPAGRTTGGAPAPPLGRLVDETGDGLTPSRTTSGTRSYRYDVSNRLIASGTDPTGWRLPAVPLEHEITRHLVAHLRTAAGQHRVLAVEDARSALTMGEQVIAVAEALAAAPGTMLPLLLQHGRIRDGAMHLTLNASFLADRLGVSAEALAPGFLIASFRFHLCRRGIETKFFVGDIVPVPDTALIRALHDSHREMAARQAGRRKSDTSSAPSGSRARRSYLAFLAPRIQQAILDGTNPEGLTLERLLAADLPMDWTVQERMLGFAASKAERGA